MDLNFYQILGVKNTANDDEIKKAYEAKIRELREAYSVLGKKETRDAYDLGQKHKKFFDYGSTTTTNQFSFDTLPPRSETGPSPSGDPNNVGGIFARAFAEGFNSQLPRDPNKPTFSFGNSPATTQASDTGNHPEAVFARRSGKIIASTIPPDRELAFVQLRLEDIYNRTTQEVAFTRHGFHPQEPPETEKIAVESSWKTGTKVTRPDTRAKTVGHEIVFYIEETPHPRFTRVNDDLFCTLVASRLGPSRKFSLTTLGDRVIVVDTPITFGKVASSVVTGEGMPIWDGSKRVGSGDLIIKWLLS